MGPCRSYDAPTSSLIITLLLLPLASGRSATTEAQMIPEEVTQKEADNVPRDTPYMGITSRDNVTTLERAVSCDNVTIEHGAVYRTTDSKLSTTLVFQCHQGYHLHPPENSTLRCQDGFISGVPNCTSIAKTCSNPCDSDIKGHCEPRDRHVFLPGETVKTVCEDGYSITKTDYDSRTCRDGAWTPDKQPTCEKSGKSCNITEQETIEHFLDSQSMTGEVLHGKAIEVKCKKGYSSKEEKVNCTNGKFDEDKPLASLCDYKGVNVEVSYTYTENDVTNTSISDGSLINFNKGENVTLTCKVSSDTEDGLPYPEVTWLYPSRLRDFVEYREGETFVHSDYRNSLDQKYSISVTGKKHYAQGVLSISPTMEVHTGEYTCVIKLVNYRNKENTATIKIKPDFVIAMYFLLIIPVVLFVIVHCFYRKATLSPFPAPNKLTKDMMQEVDKKKKLEEMKANPAYQHIQVMGEKNHRGRRGAVVDI